MSKSTPSTTRSAKQPAPQAADDAGQLSTIAGIAAVSIAVVVAIVLRFWASLDDFWLDEIWSWIGAGLLQSPFEVFTRIHHDNNHHLNTLILYAIGRDAPFYIYRLPAVFAGIGTVLLCGEVAGQWSRPAAVSATLLTGCSFLMIQYSSEARGYAYLLFFAMASFAVIQRSFESPRAIWEVLFACCAVLGFLSHLTYLVAYLALVAWSIWRKTRRDGWFARSHILPAIFEILLPVGFATFLYMVDLRYVAVGGGESSSVWRAIAQATSAAFGGPLEGAATTWITMIVAVTGIVALFLMYQSGFDLWVPMLIGIFVVPAAIVLIARPAWPYPRYFLVSMLFLQLLISWFLGWLYQQRHGNVVWLLILLIILGGNGVLTSRLLKYGRGDYQAAVRYILAQTAGQSVLIGSDHDFRNRMMLSFYFARADGQDRVGYYDMDKWPPEGPEWVLMHSFEQHFAPPASMRNAQGTTYELAQVYPYAGLSGFNWALYHNTNRPINSPLHVEPQEPAAR